MQLSLSFPVAAASLADASKSQEFLDYQLPGESRAAVLCCLLKALGIFFPPEDRISTNLPEPRSANQQLQSFTKGRSARSQPAPAGSSTSKGPQHQPAGTSYVKMGACA